MSLNISNAETCRLAAELARLDRRNHNRRHYGRLTRTS